MIITVFFDDRIETLTLPQKPAGHYVLGAFPKGSEPAACIDGRGGCWQLTPAEGLTIVPSPGQPAASEQACAAEAISKGRPGQQTVTLSCPASLLLRHVEGGTILLLMEPLLPARGRYTKVRLPKRGSLLIGRDPHSDICFAGPALSARHAVMIRNGGRTLIRDEDSTNGVYVNGKRVFARALCPGDLVFVAGLRMVFCGDHLAVSPADERLTFSDRLPPRHLFLKPPVRSKSPAASHSPALLRPPRFLRQVEPLTLTIDPPPAPPAGDGLPLALVLGSTLSMGMMSVVMLVSAVSSGNTASVWMSGAMLSGSLVIPLLTKRYERRQKKKREILRKDRYRAYLEDTRRTFERARGEQEEILRENSPSPAECAAQILQAGPRLWERSLRRNDRLLLRAGLGHAPLEAALSVPEEHFSLDDDPLRRELTSLLKEPQLLQNVPVTWSAGADPVFGAFGDPDSVQAFAAGLILQLSALYDSHELKIVLVCDCSRLPLFSFVRTLPHVWNEDRDFRFLAEDEAGDKELSAWFDPLIETRKAMGEEAVSETAPCFAFFFPDPVFAARSGLYKKLLSLRRDLRFLLFSFGSTLSELPRECQLAAELSDGRGRLFSQDDPTGSSSDFTPDPVPISRLRLLAKRMAALEDPVQKHIGFPSVLPFLQLFQAGRTEHLNCTDRWRSSDPSRSLAAPVGLDQNGTLLFLDLHERFHGPHALVAGMTGSGKSEWLSSYILSMALHFSPQEVSFVLIDYKGGGMAGAFEKLPHTAGIMTNLSGSGIARTLISLQSELIRRQALFAEACRSMGVGSVDIHGYQRWVRERLVTEPLSHLFVICDEFAELKMHHPEFMEQLISTARIGRSLGVHLILATQKPGGVVDDQIRSNSRARICLKVQDRADSMEVLNRPDAAALSAAGRFFLQVGYNELFETGQAAWSGAPYLPADRPVQAGPVVRVIDQNGRTLRSAALHPAGSLRTAPRQQDALTRYLMQTAEAEGLTAKKLWLEPLGKPRLLDELLEDHEGQKDLRPAPHALSPVLGEYDDPAHQRKGLLRLPLSEKGHTALFGSPGSGKTEALTTLLFSAVTEQSPGELRLYLLDFEAGMLAAFLDAPHTGGMLTAADEPARMNVLLKLLEDEVDSRRQSFASPEECPKTHPYRLLQTARGPGLLPSGTSPEGTYQDLEQVHSSSPAAPRILLVVHNYTAFTECFPEAEERLSRLARDCVRYGIHLLVTAASSGGIRFRSLQNFSQLLTLQQNDPSEYAAILGPTGGLIPGEQKGRGLIRLDEPVEFQTAAVCQEDPPFAFVRKSCLQLRNGWDKAPAPRLPAMPEKITAELLRNCLAGKLPAVSVSALAGPGRQESLKRFLSLPIGYDCAALMPYFFDFSARTLTPVLSETSCLSFFRLLSALLTSIGQSVFLPDPQDVSAFEVQIKKTVNSSPGSSHILLIPDLPALFEELSEEAASQLRGLLEQALRSGVCRVVFGGAPQDLSSFTYEKWYRTGVSSRDGIWLGPGFSGQYLLKAPGAAAFDDCSERHAVCLQGGRSALIRLPEDCGLT